MGLNLFLSFSISIPILFECSKVAISIGSLCEVAPEVILSRSTHFTDNNGETSLMNDKESERILHAIEEISSSGERTIAVASKNVSEYISDRNVLEQGFTFQGTSC